MTFRKFILLCGCICLFCLLATLTPKGTSCKGQTTLVDTVYMTDTIYQSYPDTLDEWQLMIMAIIGVESENNPNAVSPAGYYGHFQMSEWYMRKASELTGRDINKDNIHIFDNALDAFIAMNDEVNPEYDIDKAIKIHNPNAVYAMKIKKRMERIRGYESVRKKLTDAFNNFE